MFVGKDFTPAIIDEVQKDSPAEIAGMKKNDIILDGGKLTIDWLESEDVIMSGEVNLVFKGNFYCD